MFFGWIGGISQFCGFLRFWWQFPKLIYWFSETSRWLLQRLDRSDAAQCSKESYGQRSLKRVWKHNFFITDDQNCFDNPNAMVSVHIGSTSIHFINCYLQISLYEYWCSLETDLCRKMGQSNVTSLVFHWINDSTGNYDQGTNF